MADFTALLADLARYQDRVRLGANHRYTADGKYRPGVTTVLRTLDAPLLDAWKVRTQVSGTARAAFANPPMENEPLEAYEARLVKLAAVQYEHERLSDAAAIVGKDVHLLVEHAVKSMLGRELPRPTVCEEALFRFSGWKEWANDVGLKPLAAEARLFNDRDDYCGTADLLALAEGQPVTLDTKPTPDLWDERRLQLCAYRKALVSMGWPEMRGAIVCIPRDGGNIRMVYAEDPGPALDATYEAFRALLLVYRWQKETARAERRKERAA